MLVTRTWVMRRHGYPDDVYLPAAGPLKKSLDEAEELYTRLGTEVFTQTRLKGTTKLLWEHSYYDTEAWRTILQRNLGTLPLIGFSRDHTVPKVGRESSHHTVPKVGRPGPHRAKGRQGKAAPCQRYSPQQLLPCTLAGAYFRSVSRLWGVNRRPNDVCERGMVSCIRIIALHLLGPNNF